MESDLARAKIIMVEILVEVDILCRKHGLNYWIDFGTLLGAVRHKGFIPWDDDIDITMPRKDYNKFIEIAKQELDSKYFLQLEGNNTESHSNWLKVRHTKSIFLEHGNIEEIDKGKNGIFIDIFPLDFIHSKYERSFNLLRKLYQINPKKPFFKSNTTKFFNYLLSPLGLFQKKYKAFANRFLCTDEGDLGIYGLEAWFSHSIEKDYIFPLTEVEFEKHSFKAISKYKDHLQKYYGNYMELPPLEQRRSHAKTIQFLD